MIIELDAIQSNVSHTSAENIFLWQEKYAMNQ